ncbi:MAG: hypothetical protein H6518_02175 [Microthrixaceae bacterium]|nr:hypothetical protein [Microthrixaceae bacterium]
MVPAPGFLVSRRARGGGDNLDEHVLCDAWPEADVRREKLEEAVSR